MAFNVEVWRERIAQRSEGWKERWEAARSTGVSSLYAFLSAMALWPVVEAIQRGEPTAWMALGSVAAGVGGNLLADRIQSWKDEAGAAQQLAEAAYESDDVRIALDTVLDKLDVLSQVQTRLDEEDRAWFAEALRREVEEFGSGLTMITVTGTGAAAAGYRPVAVGEGGVGVGGDVHGDVVIGERQPKPENLRRRYLLELARDANRLPWTIVEQEYAHPERGEALGLAEVYTALDTTELERMEQEEELRRFLAQVERDETRRIPAQTMVDREPRLVILGDPGSGKSTFVKHLAYSLAQAALADDPTPWLERMAPWSHGSLLPVRVELRAVAAYAEETKREGARLLLGYLHYHLEEWELGDFWSVLNEAIGGKGEVLLVLLDGLDEVPADLRSRVVEAVQDFADRYRQHRYVVTCRPYAYVDQACQLQRFKEVTLAPFSEEQIDHFIETWYRELARKGRISSREVQNQAQKLQRAVRRGDLRELAKRPLLLTVMTLLNTFRGQLPQDRTELYADAVDLLLRRWEGRIGEEEGIVERLNIPQLKMSDLEAGLYDVAFRAHSETEEGEDAAGASVADIDEADLRKWLAPYLGDNWNKAGEFVSYIRERAGLLIRHKTEAYAFPHRLDFGQS